MPRPPPSMYRPMHCTRLGASYTNTPYEYRGFRFRCVLCCFELGDFTSTRLSLNLSQSRSPVAYFFIKGVPRRNVTTHLPDQHRSRSYGVTRHPSSAMSKSCLWTTRERKKNKKGQAKFTDGSDKLF